MSADDLLTRLRSHVGVAGPVQSARHPITTTAIADWCDAIGDANPLYVDEEAATKSRHGGLVAPPATLDIWDRPGVPGQPRPRQPALPPPGQAAGGGPAEPGAAPPRGGRLRRCGRGEQRAPDRQISAPRR